MNNKSGTLLFAVDLAGTLVFAMEGATASIRGDLDFFGLMVLAFATALGGGIVRDLLIGAVPPGAIRDWRYGAMAFLGGAVVFFLYGTVREIPVPLIMVLDAAGLSLFAVSGAGKSLAYQIQPFVAVLMGTITGVGGGTIRDVLLAQIPTVLRAEIYAVAVLAGAAVMVIGLMLRNSPTLMATAGGVVCFVLRIVSVWQHWSLPRITSP
jgi:uncharacterized membrane protein YeiH